MNIKTIERFLTSSPKQPMSTALPTVNLAQQACQALDFSTCCNRVHGALIKDIQHLRALRVVRFFRLSKPKTQKQRLIYGLICVFL